MAKSSYKPRFGWSTLAVVFLLHSQHDQRFFASAWETDGDGASEQSAGVNGQKAAARSQGADSTLDATPTDRELSTIQSAGSKDKTSAVLNEDDVDLRGQLAARNYQTGRTGWARTACRVVAIVLVLSILGLFFVSSGRAALQKEILRLQRLEALVPVAEKLGAGVGTPQSRQLLSAVEALLPEIRQTLNLAEAELNGNNRLRISFRAKPYQERISCIQDVASRTCTAIAALHKNALQELAVSKDIDLNQLSGIGSYEGLIERALGADYAKAFITSAESQGAHVDEILQAHQEVVLSSKARPLFASHRDGHLLIATIHDLEISGRLASARDTGLKFINRVVCDAASYLQRAVRQDMRAVVHEYEMLIRGLNTFVRNYQCPTEQQAERDIRRAEIFLREEMATAQQQLELCKTPKDILEVYGRFCGAADEASKFLTRAKDQIAPASKPASKALLQAVSDQLADISMHAQDKTKESRVWQSTLDADCQESLGRVSHCIKVSQTFVRLAGKLAGDVEAAAETCEKLHKEVSSQDSPKDLFERLLLAIEEDSRASKAVKGFHGVQGTFYLSMLLDDDITKSLKVMNTLYANATTPKTASANFIASQKDAVEKDLAALKETGSLSTVAETAARLRNAAYSIQLAAYEGIVPRIQDDSKK